MKSAQTETPVIFGLRYLEEEDAEINDIVGCQAIANQTQGASQLALHTTFYTTACDHTDSIEDELT